MLTLVPTSNAKSKVLYLISEILVCMPSKEIVSALDENGKNLGQIGYF